MGSVMGSVWDGASRRSGFSDMTAPPSPADIGTLVNHWHHMMESDDRNKKSKPGVTWDLDTGSPVASFPKLMRIDVSDTESRTQESVDE